MRNYKDLGAVLMAMILCLGAGQTVADAAPVPVASNLVARFTFVGTKQLEASPGAVDLKKIGDLPETAALRDEFLDKISTTPFRLFKTKLADGTTNDYAALIRPLCEDLLQEESYAEMRWPSNQSPEVLIAIHLDAARADLWQSNLTVVLTNWTGIATEPIAGDGFAGWQLKKHEDPNLICCVRAGDWTLFGWGQDEIQLRTNMVQRITERKRPIEQRKEEFLKLWIDWPGIVALHTNAVPTTSLPFQMPRMDFSVMARKTPKGYDVRQELVADFPQLLTMRVEPWQFPTNTIRNPFISFTAIRGIEPWLKALDSFKELHSSQTPNQLCMWAMGNKIFETFLALPVKDSSNYMADIAPRLVSLINGDTTKDKLPSQAEWTNDRVEFSMPFIAPAIHAISEPSGDFVEAELFSVPPRTSPVKFPPELMRELNAKRGLLYYDWEINDDRIEQWRKILPVYFMVSGKVVPSGDAPAQKWISAVQTNLGNCGTEISLTAPNQLTFLRNSALGFTGFELNMLSLWLDAPNFPLDMKYESRKHSHAASPNP